MGTNFTGITFDDCNVSPSDDGIINRTILPDGILSGCEISYSGSTLTMASGTLIACGRQFRHPAAQNWAVVDATTGYARLLITLDLTRSATDQTFDQVVDAVEYANDISGFPALVQQDLNAAGTKYQVVACVMSLGTGGISGIINTMPAVHPASTDGGTLTVTAPAGSTVTVSKDGKTLTRVAGADGIVIFRGLETGTWTLTSTNGTQTASKTVEIVADYATEISYNVIPEFTYTGDYEIVNDSDEPISVSQDNWKIRFLTSGTLTFQALNGAENGIDVFLVGGGGGGHGNGCAGGGGGGGYTTTGLTVSVDAGKSYEIDIGAGGAAGSDGGNSSAFGLTADGGKDGGTNANLYGGNGGSGGGGYGHQYAAGNGGSDGSDATSGHYPGKGQGTTTREFGDPGARLYAGGGGGGTSQFNYGTGGAGGGGNGGKNGVDPTSGTANTGGGGGGGPSGSKGGAAGGSGIVIIRNRRSA